MRSMDTFFGRLIFSVTKVRAMHDRSPEMKVLAIDHCGFSHARSTRTPSLVEAALTDAR